MNAVDAYPYGRADIGRRDLSAGEWQEWGVVPVMLARLGRCGHCRRFWTWTGSVPIREMLCPSCAGGLHQTQQGSRGWRGAIVVVEPLRFTRLAREARKRTTESLEELLARLPEKHVLQRRVVRAELKSRKEKDRMTDQLTKSELDSLADRADALEAVQRAAVARKEADAAYRSAVVEAAKTIRLEDVAKAAGITKQGVSYIVRSGR